MLEAYSLKHYIGHRSLFDSINMSLESGEAMIIHGPNGCGKTTLLYLLANLFAPSEGQIYWQGKQLQGFQPDYAADMGFMGHQLGLKQELSVKDNLSYFLAMDNEDYSESYLNEIGLEDLAEIPVRMLSFGQQKRVQLARLLQSKKKIWLLDEPLAGIDVSGIILLENILTNYLNQGGMVILTSHQDIQLKASNVFRLEMR